MSNLSIPVTKSIDLGALMRELRAAVPNLEGLGWDSKQQLLEMRSFSSSFSDQELNQIRAVLAAHDADAVSRLREEKKTKIREAYTALKAATTIAQLRNALLTILEVD